MASVQEANTSTTFIPQNLRGVKESSAPSQVPVTATTTATESPKTAQVPEYAWLIKPCRLYNEEYKDCKSFKARFHQYFINGKSEDCEHWKADFNNCTDWDKTKNADSLKKVIESERRRVRERLRAHYANDVWERRPSPPEDWNRELPESIRKGYEDSFLKKRADDLKSGEEKFGLGEPDLFDDSSCSIV